MPRRLVLKPIDSSFSLKDHIYEVLKDGITAMNIYAEDAELRLDERQLSEQLRISRTPIREALARLEQEGLVAHPAAQGRDDRAQVGGRDPRDDHRLGGAREHGGAARHEPRERCRDRLAAQDAGQVQPGGGAHPYRRVFRDQHQLPPAHSRAVEMRAAQADRGRSVPPHAGDPRRARWPRATGCSRSIVDHAHIIEALEARDADLAERLVREHTLNLHAHVQRTWVEPDGRARQQAS